MSNEKQYALNTIIKNRDTITEYESMNKQLEDIIRELQRQKRKNDRNLNTSIDKLKKQLDNNYYNISRLECVNGILIDFCERS